MAEKSKRRIKIITPGRTDVTLLFVVMFLMVFGIIMVYSSSYYHSLATFGTNSYFFIRQMLWVALGTVIMVMVSRFNHKILLRISGVIYLAVLGLLIAVLLFSEEINGSKRWLAIGPANFQPSELAKLGLILFLAALLGGFSQYLTKLRVFLPILILTSIPIALVGVENLSTALILIAIVGGMLFVIYPKIWQLVLLVVPLVGAGIWVLLTRFDYRSDRLEIWINGPFSDPTGDGFQTIQSLYAIGSGGLFGKGLGKSIQKIEFIPEAHNDIIFSIICEELGLFGAFSILVLFAIMLWRLIELIRQTSDVESMLVVVGVMTHIGIQVFINIGVVTNTIPTTGIPLPFVSYGGSSLVFLLIEIGVVLNIARQTNRMLESREPDE